MWTTQDVAIAAISREQKLLQLNLEGITFLMFESLGMVTNV